MREYKKKLTLFFIFLLGVISTLVGCSSPNSITEYIDVTFEGMDSQGIATYNINHDELYKDILNYDVNSSKNVEKVKEKIYELENSYTISIDKTEKLSNGDKIKIDVHVDQDSTKLIKSGSKTIEVKGLIEPEKLTSEEVEKKLIINFNGYSGRGKSTIDNILESPLNNLIFSIENDGELKNGDNAKVVLDSTAEEFLFENGYVLDSDFNLSFEVTGLDKVAENAVDIQNIGDITRMIDEEVNRKYKSDKESNIFASTRYEIKEEKLMYRQFETNTEQDTYYGNQNSGNLIKVFTVKRFSLGVEGKLEDTLTAIIGYTGIILDDNNEVNVAELSPLSETKDDTYSLESVIKLYEGYGYAEVENEKE